MKYFRLLVLCLFQVFICSCTESNKGFVLNGKINNFDDEYIFIDYVNSSSEKIVDSVIVKNGQFQFKGTLLKPTPIIFTSKGQSGSSREVYLENCDMNVHLSFEKKKLPSGNIINYFVVNDAYGSKTDSIFVDFTKFKVEKDNSDAWNILLYKKLEAILKENPDNVLSASLLHNSSLEAVLNNVQLRKLYSLIDWENQDVLTNARIRELIFPEDNLGIGSAIFDFALPDKHGLPISSSDFRGSFLLIDFWASWCLPCREEFPSLKKVYEAQHHNQFEILGVSIDESKERWLKALEKDGLPWPNVITEEGQRSEVPITYKVFGVPTNFLINKEGIIVAKDITSRELQVWLEKNL